MTFTLINTRETREPLQSGHILHFVMQYTTLLTMGEVTATDLETFNPEQSVQNLLFCQLRFKVSSLFKFID